MLAYLLNYLMAYLPQDEEGQGMAEYGLILALIAVAVIATLELLGQGINLNFTAVDTALR